MCELFSSLLFKGEKTEKAIFVIVSTTIFEKVGGGAISLASPMTARSMLHTLVPCDKIEYNRH